MHAIVRLKERIAHKNGVSRELARVWRVRLGQFERICTEGRQYYLCDPYSVQLPIVSTWGI